MKLKSTGQADVGVSYRLSFFVSPSLFFPPLWERGSQSVMASCRHSVQTCGLIYRVYIRQLLCTPADYSPRALIWVRP